MTLAKALILLVILSPVAQAAGEQMVVSATVQANRDNTRKAILTDEFTSEQRALERKQAQLAKATSEQANDIKAQIRNHQANIAAIQTELSRVGKTKYTAAAPKPSPVAVEAAKPTPKPAPELAQDIHRVAIDSGVPNEYDAFGGI